MIEYRFKSPDPSISDWELDFVIERIGKLTQTEELEAEDAWKLFFLVNERFSEKLPLYSKFKKPILKMVHAWIKKPRTDEQTARRNEHKRTKDQAIQKLKGEKLKNEIESSFRRGDFSKCFTLLKRVTHEIFSLDFCRWAFEIKKIVEFYGLKRNVSSRLYRTIPKPKNQNKKQKKEGEMSNLTEFACGYLLGMIILTGKSPTFKNLDKIADFAQGDKFLNQEQKDAIHYQANRISSFFESQNPKWLRFLRQFWQFFYQFKTSFT